MEGVQMSGRVDVWADVRLEPLDILETDLLRTWQNDPEVRDRTMGFRFPVGASEVKGWIESKAAQNGLRSATFAITFKGNSVGVAFLNDIEWIHRRAYFGIFIGDRSIQAKGLGFCAATLILDFAFNALGLEKICLNVVSSNENAIALYESLGFSSEGRFHQHYYVSGSFEDVIPMGLLRRNFDIFIPESARRLVMR